MASATPPGTEPPIDPLQPPTRFPNPVEAAKRQRELILRAVRGAFIILIVTVTLLNVINFGENVTPGLMFDLAAQWWIPLTASCALAGLFLALDLLTPNKKLQTFGGIIFGLIAGLIVTVAIGFVVDLIATSWEFAQNKAIVDSIKVLLGISLCYLSISIVLQTQDDFRLVIPYVEFARQIRGQRPLLLDTSALIDARIADVGETGVIQSPLVIPFFVVNELQTLADSADRLKRARGRRGLDVIARLQRSAKLDVTIDETPIPGKAVDQMLVELARQMPGMIVTGDLALSRIAGFRGIPVLNINDLANALKPALVPGETLTIHLLKPGEQPGQGVGYLDDGTMVIAEDGAGHIDRTVTIHVRSTLQTSAGRMIFGRINADGHDTRSPEAGPPEPVPTDPAPTDSVQTDPASIKPAPGEPLPEEPRPEAPKPTDPSPRARNGGPFPPNPPKRSKQPRSPRR